ncbi:hypothetical protein FGO68_gene4113 [Halteria grandinella]|uniref:Uncharacterized protein n=1 Tax=Halteria grandinella TaxID=5974 RepID=A0A8J8P0G1_HALGN|nr:hypothetical protein FGO68_gene4113 [Halteria grandinella]
MNSFNVLTLSIILYLNEFQLSPSNHNIEVSQRYLWVQRINPILNLSSLSQIWLSDPIKSLIHSAQIQSYESHRPRTPRNSGSSHSGQGNKKVGPIFPRVHSKYISFLIIEHAFLYKGAVSFLGQASRQTRKMLIEQYKLFKRIMKQGDKIEIFSIYHFQKKGCCPLNIDFAIMLKNQMRVKNSQQMLINFKEGCTFIQFVSTLNRIYRSFIPFSRLRFRSAQ